MLPAHAKVGFGRPAKRRVLTSPSAKPPTTASGPPADRPDAPGRRPPKGDTEKFAAALNEESPLAVLGYRVGARGKLRPERQDLLRRFVNFDLGRVEKTHSLPGLADWGQPGSRQRVMKIVEHLEFNLSLRRQRSDADRFADAIREWEDDLRFVKGLKLPSE